jgi:hypothetical protein
MFQRWFIERGRASAGKRIQVKAGGDMNLKNIKIQKFNVFQKWTILLEIARTV